MKNQEIEISRDLQNAVDAWIGRQERAIHPDGKFDSAKRWYPSDSEKRDCCKGIRNPSRSWPHSLNKHCRSVEHVANIFNVTASDLRKAINAQKKAVAAKA